MGLTKRLQANSPTALISETIIEATYALNINKHIVVQSSVEWVLPTNQAPQEPAEPYSVVGILRLKATV